MSLLLLFNPNAATSGPHRRRVPTPPRHITVFDPFFTNPRPVAVANVEATWSVKQPGRLSCFLPVAEAHRFGYDDWLGLWVIYDHPTQGIWGGVIEDEPATLEDGTRELAAADMTVALLSGRAAPILARPETGHAGALFRTALSLVQMTDPLPINAVAIDESGPPLEVEYRGDGLYDLAAALAQQSDQEFEAVVGADLTIELCWREQLGTDTDVLLAEGYQMAGGRIDHSRIALVNEIIGLAADTDYARSATARAESATSIERYRGRRQVVQRYEGVVTPATVKARVLRDLRRGQDAIYLLTVTLDAMHPICTDIRHGDRLRYWSHAQNRELDCRVMSRTVRDGTVLELAMEGTEVRIPPKGQSSFTPDMLSGLFAWYDAADAGTVIIRDGGVNEWHDKSGNGRHLGQGVPFSPDREPTHQPNTLNGRGVIRFDGGNDELRSLSLNLSGTSALTVYVVARRLSGAGAAGLVEFGVVGVNAGSWAIEADAGDHPRGRLYRTAVSSFEATGTWGTTSFHRVTAIFDMSLATDEVRLWLDGSDSGGRASNNNNTGGFGNGLTLDVGGPFNVSRWHGDVAEIVIYNRALSDTHRQAVEDYLTAKWGIA